MSDAWREVVLHRWLAWHGMDMVDGREVVRQSCSCPHTSGGIGNAQGLMQSSNKSRSRGTVRVVDSVHILGESKVRGMYVQLKMN